MMKLNNPICILLISFVFLFGCQEEIHQESATDAVPEASFEDAVVEQTEPIKEVEEVRKAVAEPAVEIEKTKELSEQEELSQENAEAKQKLVFAQSRLSMAQKGIMGYSQTVVLCRDVIKQYPGTQYERQARTLLGQIPKDRLSQYNITDEELGL
jgi:hypothetical protein